eukprot:gene2858-1843_t
MFVYRFTNAVVDFVVPHVIGGVGDDSVELWIMLVLNFALEFSDFNGWIDRNLRLCCVVESCDSRFVVCLLKLVIVVQGFVSMLVGCFCVTFDGLLINRGMVLFDTVVDLWVREMVNMRIIGFVAVVGISLLLASMCLFWEYWWLFDSACTWHTFFVGELLVFELDCSTLSVLLIVSFMDVFEWIRLRVGLWFDFRFISGLVKYCTALNRILWVYVLVYFLGRAVFGLHDLCLILMWEYLMVGATFLLWVGVLLPVVLMMGFVVVNRRFFVLVSCLLICGCVPIFRGILVTCLGCYNVDSGQFYYAGCVI